MKSTGIIRKVDELGRIVLPVELRRTLKISERDSLEIYVDGDKIILQKQQSGCVFCGGEHALTEYKGRMLCADCLEALASLH